MRTAACLECLAATRALVGDTPLIPMTYASLLEAYGWERFESRRARRGCDELHHRRHRRRVAARAQRDPARRAHLDRRAHRARRLRDGRLALPRHADGHDGRAHGAVGRARRARGPRARSHRRTALRRLRHLDARAGARGGRPHGRHRGRLARRAGGRGGPGSLRRRTSPRCGQRSTAPQRTRPPSSRGSRRRAASHNAAMESLRGQLLVAGPDLLDPNFRRTVVLVGEHGDEGAMGVVLNRPSPVSVADAVPPLAELVETDELVHVGGPVQSRRSSCSATSATRPRRRRSCSVRSASCRGEIETRRGRRQPRAGARLRRATPGGAPASSRARSPRSSWIIEPALPDDVFTEDPEGLWSAVLRRKGGPFAVLARCRPTPARTEARLVERYGR